MLNLLDSRLAGFPSWFIAMSDAQQPLQEPPDGILGLQAQLDARCRYLNLGLSP